MDIQPTEGLNKKQERRLVKEAEKVSGERSRNLRHLGKRITLWTTVIVVLAGIVWGMAALVKSVPTNPGQGAQPLTVNATDWKRGSATPKVTLIEYSDFQCPACGYYHPLVKKLLEDFPNDLQVVYRHFPLYSIHKNAGLAAKATEAAGKQNKFWEMHDQIFEHQSEWSNKTNARPDFERYATVLNLYLQGFKEALDSKEIEQNVDNDYNGGVAIDINATPSFFINGQKIENPRDYNGFKQLVGGAGATR